MKKWILRISVLIMALGVIGVFIILDPSKNYDYGIADLGGRTAVTDGKANDGWGLPIFMR